MTVSGLLFAEKRGNPGKKLLRGQNWWLLGALVENWKGRKEGINSSKDLYKSRYDKWNMKRSAILKTLAKQDATKLDWMKPRSIVYLLIAAVLWAFECRICPISSLLIREGINSLKDCKAEFPSAEAELAKNSSFRKVFILLFPSVHKTLIFDTNLGQQFSWANNFHVPIQPTLCSAAISSLFFTRTFFSSNFRSSCLG